MHMLALRGDPASLTAAAAQGPLQAVMHAWGIQAGSATQGTTFLLNWVHCDRRKLHCSMSQNKAEHGVLQHADCFFRKWPCSREHDMEHHDTDKQPSRRGQMRRRTDARILHVLGDDPA